MTKIFSTEIVHGTCPECTQKTLLVGIANSYYRCSNCGQDCKNSYENFQPCMNCLYYGEFETIDGETTNAFGRWEPPYIECKKLCMNCIDYY